MLDQCGFSGTGMSDNAYKLPVLDLEIHIKKGMLLKGRTISVYIIQINWFYRPRILLLFICKQSHQLSRQLFPA